MKELELNLNQYKEFTLKIISSIEEEKFDILNELLNQRGDIIKEISNLNCSKEEFKVEFEKLGLAELDQKMKSTLIQKRENIKDKMEKLNKSKNLTLSYNKDLYRRSGIFSKKV